MIQKAKFSGLLGAVLVAASSLAPCGPALAQGTEDDVARIMGQMTSSEKVGQLFLVTFPGTEVTEDSAITALIRQYHIGGVLLDPANGNILNEGETPTQVAQLVTDLQHAAWQTTQPITETADVTSTVEAEPRPFIPLFVATRHEGNGFPFTSVSNGMTPLPSQMALGATWNPDHANAVGRIAGKELEALGINLLLGPSLDVLETPRPGSAGDLGVRTFGGEPYWVGEMGKAYVRGVHEGSSGGLLVIAKHFPGLGASDRSLDEEIPTVQRTLEKLRQVDLAPFFATTRAQDPLSRIDGVVVSHVRFRGLEGDRFATTRPISVDNQWLQRLLQAPELSQWRADGGITVSDELGLRSLERFYDPTEEAFNGRRIAREAFLAGNDILTLSRFALGDGWDDQVANMRSTIEFFQERYDSDPSFQTLVDAAVARILRQKLRVFGNSFNFASAAPNVELAAGQGGSESEVLAQIGRDAITLISPPTADLVPPPPTPDDNIVIFTDSREGRPCADCASLPFVDPEMPEATIVRLYGPQVTGQISLWRMARFTFEELTAYLDTPILSSTPTAPAEGEDEPVESASVIDQALQQADWILFVVAGPVEAEGKSSPVRRFLAERADALRDPDVVVLTYDVPYYLDATEISKLSAYFVTYGRVAPLIEVSMRALFREFAPTGTPPVDVAGINYSLQTAISPDPKQVISVYASGAADAEQDSEAPLQLKVGDELTLKTGTIVDRNGHRVPDGTAVQFIFSYPQEGLEHSVSTVTIDGVARTTVALERTGQLNVYTQADPVPRSIALQILIQEGQPVTIVRITPTPAPTRPPTPTPTLGPDDATSQNPAQLTPEAGQSPGGGDLSGSRDAGILDLGLALASVAAVAVARYYTAQAQSVPLAQTVRVISWSIVGGLASYLACVLGMPGVSWICGWAGIWGSALIPLAGCVAGLSLSMAVTRQA